MTVKDVAAYLNVSTKTIYNMVRDGRLPAMRVGGQYRFSRAELDAGLRKGRPDTLRQELASVPSGLERRLLFMGKLTAELEQNDVRPILVGGNAVEFYTAGGYATADVDIIAPHTAIDRVLSAWDFKREGRFWFDEELGLAVEAPDSVLAGDMDRLTAVDFNEYTCYIIGLEDLVVDRLNAAVHWRSENDEYWAGQLILSHYDSIDWPYLQKRCRDEKTEKMLKKLKRKGADDAPG